LGEGVSLKGEYKRLHEESETIFRGRMQQCAKWEIGELMGRYKSKTLLDYGCGKGKQYREEEVHKECMGGIVPTLYDPGVVEYERKPEGVFDGVICVDVLEHVPEEDLDVVVGDLVRFSRQWCFMLISCSLSGKKKRLADGRNLHVTLWSPEKWVEFMRPYFARKPEVEAVALFEWKRKERRSRVRVRVG
jgi:2-polyprenyl-3-methyl-5-hydroxy-6-metoxy-1,4-benzoquinol methylase